MSTQPDRQDGDRLRYELTQEDIGRLHGAAHGGALLGGDSAYEGCLKVEALLAGIIARGAIRPARNAAEGAEWKDDPSADERWQAGLDFGMLQLCATLGVDPKSVRWDAATETLDGDVSAVIWNILRAKMGDDWDPHAVPSKPAPATMRERFNYDTKPAPDAMREALAYASTNQIAVCRCGSFPRLYGDGARPDDGYRSLWCQTCMEHVAEMKPSEREVIDYWNDLREREHAALAAPVPPADGTSERLSVPYNPCLAKLREGEPFFVLLGRDKQAPNAVMTWANDRQAAEGKSAWTDQAREVAYAMAAYSGLSAPSPSATVSAEPRIGDLTSLQNVQTTPAGAAEPWGRPHVEYSDREAIAPKAIAEAFSDWAWNKKGEAIGNMLAHEAAKVSFFAGAQWVATLPVQPGAGERPRWKHKNRGTLYTEIGRGKLQSMDTGGLTDNEPMVIYQGDDGQLWVRDVVEFEDGRFEFVPPSRQAPDSSSESGR